MSCLRIGTLIKPRWGKNARSCRLFSASSHADSGHSHWATIKHDKKKNDDAKQRMRGLLISEIVIASRLFGPDLSSNSRLAFAVTKAKKASCPKSAIDAAIARGQNSSESGDALEPMVEEYMVAPGMAMIIDCLTENKAKARMELRTLMKKHGATPSSVSYLFRKKGVIRLKRKPGIDLEAVLLSALDAGALDAEEGESGYLVFTEASNVSTVGEALERGLSVEIDDAEVVWDPETRLASVPRDVALQLMEIERHLKEMPSIRSVYTNAPLGQR